MNIQPGRITGERKHTFAPRSEAGRGRFGVLFKLLLIFLALAAVCNAHIYLMQRTAESGRKARALAREIDEIGNDNTNLRNRREALSDWRHIQTQIARFNLRLRSALPGQVRPMPLYSPRQAALIPLTPVAVASRGPRGASVRN